MGYAQLEPVAKQTGCRNGRRRGCARNDPTHVARTTLPHAKSASSADTLELGDDVLIRHVAQKDNQAFQTLYYRYAPKLAGYLWRMLRRQELVEEAVDDVMMTVWNNADRFDFRSRLSSWIFGIAYKKALKALSVARRDAERMVCVGDDEGLYDTVVSGTRANEPEAAVEREQVMQLVANALERLSHNHRTVVELACVEGFTYRDIALIMDCPEATVKTRMFHARKLLSSQLKGEGFELGVPFSQPNHARG